MSVGEAEIVPEPAEIIESAHAVVTASFSGDVSAVRHIALAEEDPTYLVMALGQLCARSLDSLAEERGCQSGSLMWGEGLRRRAADS